jgi:hypothetical protein
MKELTPCSRVLLEKLKVSSYQQTTYLALQESLTAMFTRASH